MINYSETHDWSVKASLGGGVAHLRGRHGRISRRERQAMYRTSLVVTVGFLIAGLALWESESLAQ